MRSSSLSNNNHNNNNGNNETEIYDPCHECKKDFIHLENIKEIGYYFDEDGILRYIKDNSPFPFKSLLVPLFKVLYDIFSIRAVE